ncbi:uncharacterized protein HKW66_Vig0161740 [Vigna angularis]|uniref:Uncharacterized protein n=1 Tax=Phaseolus angularis TaxID=3914 RepID=A0A8T0JL49_PHAAN|nr:uncharacterized protein HKW66_Vig0161740 [Vigna angularis]
MGKKGGAKKSESVSHAPISLREEVTGKLQTKAASETKSKLRFEHLKNLAVWATTNDPPIHSLGAFYGHQFATFGESIGVPPDNSLIICQRCKTVLQPGFNSTVRIEKIKSSLESTPPSKSIVSDSCKIEKGIASKDGINEINVFPSRGAKTQSTSSSTNTKTLLEGKRRRQDSPLSNDIIKTTNMSGKGANPVSTSIKRRRKSWMSLKEIAQSKEHKNSQIGNLTIPVFL